MNSNTKAQELPLKTVVSLVIMLIVLIVVVSYFLTTTGDALGPLSNILTDATEEATDQAGKAISSLNFRLISA